MTLVSSGWNEYWIKRNGSIVVLEKGDVECDCDGVVAKAPSALRHQKENLRCLSIWRLCM